MTQLSKNRTKDSKEDSLDLIISRSPIIDEIMRIVKQVATSDIIVLISGESGTGKELVARAIHSLSKRASKQMITMNCGAIPEGIFESEIFGHEKGSFTSADQRRRGYFEMANSGTLFLDEIGEMPLPAQVKLLRVIETGTFTRVGGSEEIKVDVRIIAATNRDLDLETKRGRFRQDLYYRLKAVNIVLPPLRERMDDIPLLVERFSIDFAQRNSRSIQRFDQQAIEIMQRHYWTGNIRELKNFVESVLALSSEPVINANDIYRLLPEANVSNNLPVLLTRSQEELDRELLYRTLLEIRSDLSLIKSQLQHLTETRKEINFKFDNAEDVETIASDISEHDQQVGSSTIYHGRQRVMTKKLDEIEKEQIIRALDQFRGNRRLVAQALGIGERTLYRKIKHYGIL